MNRCVAKLFEPLIVAHGFKLLVVEVFDGFKVQQRIDCFLIGFGIHFIHALAVLGAPFGDAHGVSDVADQRSCGDADEHRVVFCPQEPKHHEHLDQCGHNGHERKANQGAHTASATFDVTRQTTCLAAEVKFK